MGSPNGVCMCAPRYLTVDAVCAGACPQEPSVYLALILHRHFGTSLVKENVIAKSKELCLY